MHGFKPQAHTRLHVSLHKSGVRPLCTSLYIRLWYGKNFGLSVSENFVTLALFIMNQYHSVTDTAAVTAGK